MNITPLSYSPRELPRAPYEAMVVNRYLNEEQTYTASCGDGTDGEDVTVTIEAGAYESTTSQAHANQLALDVARDNATIGLTCTPVPLDPPVPVYKSETVTRRKRDVGMVTSSIADEEDNEVSFMRAGRFSPFGMFSTTDGSGDGAPHSADFEVEAGDKRFFKTVSYSETLSYGFDDRSDGLGNTITSALQTLSFNLLVRRAAIAGAVTVEDITGIEFNAEAAKKYHYPAYSPAGARLEAPDVTQKTVNRDIPVSWQLGDPQIDYVNYSLEQPVAIVQYRTQNGSGNWITLENSVSPILLSLLDDYEDDYEFPTGMTAMTRVNRDEFVEVHWTGAISRLNFSTATHRYSFNLRDEVVLQDLINAAREVEKSYPDDGDGEAVLSVISGGDGVTLDAELMTFLVPPGQTAAWNTKFIPEGGGEDDAVISANFISNDDVSFLIAPTAAGTMSVVNVRWI